MTTPDEARAALDDAQSLYEQVIADLPKLDRILDWLEEAVERQRRLEAYYGGLGQQDIATVLNADPGAVTPPVANQDAVWQATVEYSGRYRRLVQIAETAAPWPLEDEDADYLD